MLKWRGFQRGEVLVPQPDSTSDIGVDQDAYATVPLTTSGYIEFNDELVTSPVTKPSAESLLISKDIEALLEEDDRRRSQEKSVDDTKTTHLVPSFDETGASIVGLPAPPRGPRKTVVRERGQRGRIREDLRRGRLLAPQVLHDSVDPHACTEQRTMAAKPMTNSSQPPSIQDVPIEQSSSLGLEVMNALNAKEIFDATELSDPVRLSAVQAGPDASYLKISQAFNPTAAGQMADEEGKAPTTRAISSGSAERSSITVPNFSHETTSNLTNSTNVISPSLSLTPGMTDFANSRPTRPFLTHAHTNSRDSDFSHSSFSSHDPPSSAYEPRISISSTIYPSSACNSLPPPVPERRYDRSADAHSSFTFSEAASNIALEDQPRARSIIDLTSPTSPDLEALSTPRFADRDEITSDYSPIEFADGTNHHDRVFASFSDMPERPSSAGKPALPTAPKPEFRRSRSVQPVSKTPKVTKPPSPSTSPKFSSLIPYNLLTSLTSSDNGPNDPLPPTTNFLNAQERAELVRKTRKLTQVFGQTPSPISGPEELPDSPVNHNCLLPMIPSRKVHTRGALSASDALQVANLVRGIRDQRSSPLSPNRGPPSASALSPITFRSSYFVQDDEPESPSPYDSPVAQTPPSSNRKNADASTRSPEIVDTAESFMDLADPDQHSLARTSSAYSLAESMTESQKAEVDRRRKRERLAKLHRFLGSRVPAELILGPHETGAPLPPPARLIPLASDDIPSDDGEGTSPARRWARGKRRNSLASSLPTHFLADSERMKEDLNDKEKAINVKRALKMERMFGEQPPQNLFHTRNSVSLGRTKGSTIDHSTSAPTSPVGRNVNRSAYRKGKYSKRKDDRPGTSESRKGLLGGNDLPEEFGGLGVGNEEMTEVYMHYRHSLISLTNIVDNDDKRSLAELHEYINGDQPKDQHDRPRVSREQSKRSLQSERRRSMPHQASYSSLASQYTITDKKVEITPFELRRRRAAKLSQFFGVGYRDLFGEVLDSIEIGVREDEGKGTLRPDEVRDLIAQLRTLKKRRDEFS